MIEVRPARRVVRHSVRFQHAGLVHVPVCASVRSSDSDERDFQLAREACVVEFAVVEEDMRIGVGGHGERALSDAGAD